MEVIEAENLGVYISRPWPREKAQPECGQTDGLSVTGNYTAPHKMQNYGKAVINIAYTPDIP